MEHSLKQNYAFKYLKAEHLPAFKKHGQIRLGTIEEYRAIENDKIQDYYEGRTSYLFSPIDEDIHLSIEEANSILYKSNVTAPLTIPAGGGININLEVPNEHIFCMSQEYDAGAMKTMGYNVSYRINDLKKFNNIIYEKIMKKLGLLFWAGGKVNYVKSKLHTVTNKNKAHFINDDLRQVKDGIKSIHLDDYFIKTNKFEHENELRTVFISKESLISIHKPFIIDIPELVGLCDF